MASKAKKTKEKAELTVSRAALLVEGSDVAFRQFVHDMLAFSARLQEVRGHLGATIGLSGTQYTVLIAIAHLCRIEEKVGVNQVAEHLHFSGAFITIEINKLVAAGLVTKQTDAEDRRRVNLAITPAAQLLLNKLAPVQRPANDTLFGCFSAQDFKKFRGLMSDMVRAGDEALHQLQRAKPPASHRKAKQGRSSAI